jgi:hypothetical protein
MRARLSPIAWAMGLGFVCARAGADAAPLPADAQAGVTRAQASASVASMEGAARRARVILHRARERGQSKEVRCADEALSRVDSALRAGREHAALVGEALRRGDLGSALVELARVVVAAAWSRDAGAEAELCIDEARPREGTSVRLIIEEP